MSDSKSNVIAITDKTAKDFLLEELQKGGVDLGQLAATARKAIEGSDVSLKVAGDIANSGWLARLWNSGEFAKHVVESIGHIRDISKVNLALSAVCNDLAATNLIHAQRIDANHFETSQQLQQVQGLTSALLEHLRTARESSLLQPIALALADVDTGDKDALHGWLDSFSEAIDQQYAALQENLQQLAQQQAVASQEVVRFSAELSSLSAFQKKQKGDRTDIQIELVRLSDTLKAQQAQEATTLKETKRVAAALTEQQKQEGRNRLELVRLSDTLKAQQAQEATTLKETKRVAAALTEQQKQDERTQLELERFDIALKNHQEAAADTQKKLAQFDTRLQTLQDSSAHQHALLSTQVNDYAARFTQHSKILDATVRQSHEKLGAALIQLNTRLGTQESDFKHRLDTERQAREAQDTSVQQTINALNRRWLKRLSWVAGSLLLAQVAGFAYLSVYSGLWK